MPAKGCMMPIATREKIKATKQSHPYTHTEEIKEKMRQKAARPRPYLIKGQKYTDQGYVLIYRPNHPGSDNRGYIKRAIVVMEEKLGRFLLPEEVTHHENKIKDDDKPENLQLFANNSEHVRFHQLNGDLHSIGGCQDANQARQRR